MANTVQIKVPDIGDFEGVPVIEILVQPGDRIDKEASLITLESDKATMEIPSPRAGKVEALLVQVGDTVSQGDPILSLEVPEEGASGEAPPPRAEEPLEPPAAAAAGGRAAARAEGDLHAEVLVLGAGPGGYSAAFRAADLGKQVVLVERYPTLGGVCLNVGCIPSKALLHTAEVIRAAAETARHGVRFGAPEIDVEALRGWKDGVVGKLTGGLEKLAKQRKVQVLQGTGRFYSANSLRVEDAAGGEQTVTFDHAIIAAGSRVARIPGIPWDDPRVMDSTGALELRDIPERLLVVGGGIIGLEMATVYSALGSRITVAELTDGLIPGCDRDLVKPLQRRIAKQYDAIYLGTRVTGVEARDDGLEVRFEGAKAPESARFDRILVATGRRPNGDRVGAENAQVYVDERGFIKVDRQQRTNVTNIFAIGDVVGQPMLAHKAVHEGKVAAEVIAGKKSTFDARAIPNVAYTDPEVAWMGVSEQDAADQDMAVDKGVFPWAASGRSLGMGRDEGMTKLLFDQETGRLVGAGIVGPHAGDLISEAMLGVEMGTDAADIALTVHPHPTLSETVAFAAEMVEGSITDLLPPRRR